MNLSDLGRASVIILSRRRTTGSDWWLSWCSAPGVLLTSTLTLFIQADPLWVVDVLAGRSLLDVQLINRRIVHSIRQQVSAPWPAPALVTGRPPVCASFLCFLFDFCLCRTQISVGSSEEHLLNKLQFFVEFGLYPPVWWVWSHDVCLFCKQSKQRVVGFPSFVSQIFCCWFLDSVTSHFFIPSPPHLLTRLFSITCPCKGIVPIFWG